MTVRITLEYSTAAEAVAALSKLAGDAQAPKVERAQSTGGKPSQVKEGAGTASAPSQPTAPAAPAAAPAAKARLYTDTGLSDLINACVKAGKMAEAKKILSDFGVTKGPELKPEQFDDAIAKFTALGASSADLG